MSGYFGTMTNWQYSPPYNTWNTPNLQQGGWQAPVNYGQMTQQRPLPNQMQPFDNVIKVAGRPGAEAFWLPPNSRAILMDANEAIFYLKTTDDGGYPTIMEFPFTGPVQHHEQKAIEANAVDTSNMVSRAEFEEFKRMMIGGGDA